jgi:hypothetical protein
MDLIPHIIEAEYFKEYKIKIKFDDGAIKIADLESYTRRGGIFSALKDMKYFRNYYIDLNTLCWPNGADIAPEHLYEIGLDVHEKSLVKV